MIDYESKEITVKHQCQLLELPRSTAYYQKRERPKLGDDEISIKNAIDRIHFLEPSYGVRRIRVELNKLGFRVGKKRIRRYMQEMCIVAFYPGPNLSKRDLAERTYPYLLRNVQVTKPNQVWGIDITYCGTPGGFVYLVAIVDWYSRLVVGYSVSNTMQTELVIRAVEDAVRTHGTPEIINSDQGSQFTSKAYIDCIKSYETIKISMNGKGRATDNAITERFFRNIKWERYYPECPETVTELKEMTKKYITHYNYNRPHQSLKYKTPGSIYYANNGNARAA